MKNVSCLVYLLLTIVCTVMFNIVAVDHMAPDGVVFVTIGLTLIDLLAFICWVALLVKLTDSK